VHILIEHADVRSPSAAEIILNGNPNGGNPSFHRGPGTYGSAFVLPFDRYWWDIASTYVEHVQNRLGVWQVQERRQPLKVAPLK
jgi:hypothetical protein